MSIAAPSNPYVVNYADMRALDFPVSGAGANIPVGTPMMPGVTAGTNLGVLIPVTASSVADALGLLAEPHIFSGVNSSGDATTATLVQWFPVGAFAGVGGTILGQASVSGVGGPFPSHKINLFDTLTAVKLDYAISDATAFTVTTASSSTVMTTNTFQAGLDSSFAYYSAGTAIGELGFIKSSINATSATLVSALAVNFAAGDTVVLINPLFMALQTLLVNSATVPTKIDTNFAAGTATVVCLANFIVQNGLWNRLDPKIFHKSQNLNKLNQLGFVQYAAFQDTIFHPGS